MNYRHAFHAGNFADVVKHAVLTRILVHLAAKDTAYRVLDTHAGIGLYDLASDAATRTGEWRGGIGRLIGSLPRDPALADLLAPYLATLAEVNGTTAEALAAETLSRYPGSPVLVRRLLRRQDRLTATELHPADAATLSALFAGDVQARIVELDGWLAAKSFLPFKERRGLVLIDPPFEVPGEFDRLVGALVEGHRRFATAVYALWYPIKDEGEAARFREAVVATGIRRILAVELRVSAVRPASPLSGTGMILVNPPWRLAEELDILLPWLASCLAAGPGAGARVDRLVGE